MKIQGPPWPVRTLYEDGRFTIYWHGGCGLGRSYWTLLIAVGMESRSVCRA